MTWKYGFFLLLMASLVINCSKSKELTVPISRTVHPSQISSFHPSMSISVGWVPYEDQRVIRTIMGDWKVVQTPRPGRSSSVPVLVLSYPNTQDSIFLQMDTKNELLGKLIKHSVITQEPISRPFTEFFKKAECQKCHPAHIQVDLGE